MKVVSKKRMQFSIEILHNQEFQTNWLILLIFVIARDPPFSGELKSQVALH